MIALIDSNVLLDVMTKDPAWYQWSSTTIKHHLAQGTLLINPIIYAEVSVGYAHQEALDAVLPDSVFKREPLPWEAAFIAGKAFLKYRRSGGNKTSPLPDFYIGAHAQITKISLITRDARRYRTYFPSVDLITPNDDPD